MTVPTTDLDAFEARVAAAARAFPYPPTATPAMLGRTAPARRFRPVLAWAAVLLVTLLGAFAVPSVRAAVVEFFQIGVMRIFTDPIPTGAPPATPLPQLRNLSGRTTLVEATDLAGLPIRYPAALGEPDEVYVQEIEGPLVLMVWLEDGELKATLLTLGPGAHAGKGQPELVLETTVSGYPAVWLEGEHFLELKTTRGGFTYVSFFEAGNALVWEVGEITYRLEGIQEMEAAIEIAETMTGTP
jgi:hypothetical protein